MSDKTSYLNMAGLKHRARSIKKDFQSAKPFRFVSFDGIFKDERIDEILDEYPKINDDWNGTTYINQKNKFQKSEFEPSSTMQNVFDELNSPVFVNWLQIITEIKEPILSDPTLFGGGLHQSVNGAFLNVHVDYNIHPETKHHRRLNVIVYMNNDWQDQYEGHLELWDLSNGKKDQIARIAPNLNRCVIFETNEISFHGHPAPLKTPKGINRKSIATYYYSKVRPVQEVSDKHNTIYVNTRGFGGQVKLLSSGIKALLERINNQ